MKSGPRWGLGRWAWLTEDFVTTGTVLESWQESNSLLKKSEEQIPRPFLRLRAGQASPRKRGYERLGMTTLKDLAARPSTSLRTGPEGAPFQNYNSFRFFQQTAKASIIECLQGEIRSA